MTDNNFKLSKQQEHEICFIIGDWYLKWKEQIIQHDSCAFGLAVDDLKKIICGLPPFERRL